MAKGLVDGRPVRAGAPPTGRERAAGSCDDRQPPAGAEVASGAAAWLLPLLVALFFLTGISGLIYQVLWLRLLSLVFGVTIWAASTVLASFMAGLALGSFGAGKLVDRARNPLVWYGVAELLVGLSALATPLALALVERLYVELYPALAQALGPLTLVRFALSFAVLLVPTTLMGATLPIIVKSSLLQAEGLGQRVSLLYATNTAGAIAGTLLAGFYLVGGIGIDASFHLAAALNVAVGLVAIVAGTRGRLSRPAARADGLDPARAGPTRAAAPESRAATRAAATRGAMGAAGIVVARRTRRLVLLVFTLSGFASLALEVIWFRVLVLFLDVTTYAFTIMLATFLAGIAAGSYLVAPLMRRRLDWLAVLAGLELAIGIVSLLSMAALTHSYDVLAWIEAIRGRPFGGQLAPMLIASFLAVFPTTLLLGIAFPIGLSLWSGGDGEHAGERIGLFYALNTVGAILGSVAAGFLLLPRLGSQASLAVVAAISLAAGLLFLFEHARTPRPPSSPEPLGSSAPAGKPHHHSSRSPQHWGRVPSGWRGRTLPLLTGAVAALAFVLAAATMPSPFDAVLQHRYAGERTLWREEGVQTTVTVNQHPDGHRIMYLDGLHQANDTPDMVFLHRLIGFLPMALHPEPRQALVIGLGGGVTAGAVSDFHRANVDVVELAQSVIHGSDWFRGVNGDVLRRPNVRLRTDDGRNYLLLLPPGQYDVITADIIQPFHAGAGNLYSVEYFRLARAALKDDGLMLQWIGPLPETQYKLIMRTFLDVFPDATLWFEGSLMVGSKRPLRLNPDVYARNIADPQMGADDFRQRFPTLPALFGAYWAGPKEMRDFVGPGPLLTDDRPMVEYFRSLPRDEPPRDVSNVRGDALELLAP